MKYQYTIGSDFEVPILNTATGEYVSGIGMIGGTKANPIEIGNGCFKQEDNVAAEFNIPPVMTEDDFVEKINYCLSVGTDLIKSYNDNYEFDLVSSAKYPKKELEHKKARTFGCSSSHNAYTMEDQNSPSILKMKDMRTFGFHIHIGLPNELLKDENIYHLVKVMDRNVGILNKTVGTDTFRTMHYGFDGEFRFKDYGLEYRVLGSELLTCPLTVYRAVMESLVILENDVAVGVVELLSTPSYENEWIL